MPLIQIHLLKGTSAKQIQLISDGIHQALGAAWQIAPNARFQVIQEHASERLQMNKQFWGQNTSKKRITIVVIAIKRTAPQKKKLFNEILKNLHKGAKIKKEDIFISLIDTQPENFYV